MKKKNHQSQGQWYIVLPPCCEINYFVCINYHNVFHRVIWGSLGKRTATKASPTVGGLLLGHCSLLLVAGRPYGCWLVPRW